MNTFSQMAEDWLRQYRAETAAQLEENPAVQALDDLLPGEWLLEQCAFKDGWWGGVGCLFLSLARWCAPHGWAVPESRRAFEAALQAEGFAVTTDGLVYGLVLKVDVEAHEQFQNSPETAYNLNCKTSGHKTGHNTRKAKA